MKIGFIGTGLMGRPMVLRLLEAGRSLAVWNRSKDKTRDLVQRGARACDSIEELVEECDIVMLCVSDTAAVESVVFGEGGVAGVGSKHKVLVDFSSIDPIRSREMARQLSAECGMDWLDAPVSGGTAGAENGSLIIMVGGELQVLERIRPVFDPLCQRLSHMGPCGAGQMTKLCNQMVVANNVLVIAEMMALGRKAGVDVDKLSTALAGGFADSIPFQILAPQMAEHDFTLKWKVTTLQKDLSSAVDLADRLGAEVPMSRQGSQLLHHHSEAGAAQRDLSTVITLYEEERKQSAC